MAVDAGAPAEGELVEAEGAGEALSGTETVKLGTAIGDASHPFPFAIARGSGTVLGEGSAAARWILSPVGEMLGNTFWLAGWESPAWKLIVFDRPTSAFVDSAPLPGLAVGFVFPLSPSSAGAPGKGNRPGAGAE
jgi:hypothetical protein